MRLRHRRFICIITSFIMAVTVFGCTSLSFAEETSETSQKLASPANLIATGGDKAVSLSWGAVDPVAEGTVSYRLSCDELSGFSKTTSEITYEADAEDGIEAATTYTFRIKAVEYNSDNEVVASSDTVAFLSATTNAEQSTVTGVIAAPESFTATTGEYSLYRSVKLTWSAVTDENYSTISYEITDPDGNTVETSDLEWTFKDLSPKANSYAYTIKAIGKDAEGNDKAISEGKTAVGQTTDFSAQRLTGLCSDPGYRAVLLEWKPVDGATGYLIFRRRGEERGNAGSSVGSDGRVLRTFQSGSAKRCYQKFQQTGYSQIIDLKATAARKIKNATTGEIKIEYRDGGLQDLNMTYVYFYQYVIVPYFDYTDPETDTTTRIFCKGNDGAEDITDKTLKSTIGSDVNVNTVKNNTVLPMYILYKVKKKKPYYRTNKMSDGKKMGRLSKGTYYIGFDKKDGRNRFYMKKSGTSRTEWWFAQKNTKVVQGYYLYNGNSKDIYRKDWQYGYSKKTVLDYVNNSGMSSSTGYLIWVSKYAQHVYIFTGKKRNWKLVNNGSDFVTTGSKASWSNLCASGKVIFNSRNNNGPIKGKQYRKKTKKYWYYNISKLHSTERLHSVLYKKKAKFGSGKYYDRTLGVPKSNGCIRLKPGASQFIYNYCKNGTKVFVY